MPPSKWLKAAPQGNSARGQLWMQYVCRAHEEATVPRVAQRVRHVREEHFRGCTQREHAEHARPDTSPTSWVARSAPCVRKARISLQPVAQHVLRAARDTTPGVEGRCRARRSCGTSDASCGLAYCSKSWSLDENVYPSFQTPSHVYPSFQTP